MTARSAALCGALCTVLLPGVSARAADRPLSEMWKLTDAGIIIQLSAQDRLIFDGVKSPYILNGQRLVIRAAHVVLKDPVKILEFDPASTGPSTSDYDKAADKGADGADGGNNGEPGRPGADGSMGRPGKPAGMMTLNFGTIDGAGSLTIDGGGQKGGPGQRGQTGGKGGTAGRGTDAVQGVDCKQSGGNAGTPGDGGPGGKGGKGGPGGAGSHIRISKAAAQIANVTSDPAKFGDPGAGKIEIFAGGGPGGEPGPGGKGGEGGEGNDGGSGSFSCDGGHGSSKKPKTADEMQDLGKGDRGANGNVMTIQ